MKSSELQNVLNRTPTWIIRSGTGMLFVILLLILIGSFVLRYPDVITTNITVSTDAPPITIYAKHNGYLSTLFVKDNEFLKKDDIIGILETSTNFDDLKQLKRQIDSIEKKLVNGEMLLLPKTFVSLQLGSLQQYYTDFVFKMREYQNLKNSDYRAQQITSLKIQLADNLKYEKELEKKRTITSKDFAIAHKQFMRDSILFVKKIISNGEYDKSRSQLYKSEISYESTKAEVVSNRVKNNEINAKIKELEAQKYDNENLLLSAVYSNLNILKGQIDEWYLNNIIISPIAGQISFSKIYKENQYVVSNTPIFSIIPEHKDHMVGRIEIPILGSGKVAVGQQVNIKLDNFPHQEFGLLKTQIMKLSPIPHESTNGVFYIAEVSLPGKLITNYNIELKLNQQLRGTAEIITKDRRLIERFLDPIISIFKNGETI